MRYEFWKRNRDASPFLAATAIVEGDVKTVTSVTWEGDESVRDWLYTNEFPWLDEKFDPNNIKHWRQVPQLVQGTRLWAARASEEEFKALPATRVRVRRK